MKKTLSLLLVLLLAAGTALADDISREQAMQIAAKFATGSQPRLAKARGFSATTATPQPQVAYTVPSKVAAARDNIYVVNLGSDQGFVIVSGETGTDAEVLGYCDHGSFSYDDCPVQMKALLTSYSAGIDAIRQNPQAAAPSKVAADDIGDIVVGPLLTTTWDQHAPYNMFCPEGCPAGCVVTAVTQIMYYWKWPKETRGKLREPTTGLFNGEDFSGHVYEWENMLDSYAYGVEFNMIQAEAVAKLMADVGKALGTEYSPEGSGTGTDFRELHENFSYDVNYDAITENLPEAMKVELDQRRPMLYSAMSSVVGVNSAHELVVDGYTSNNYFHFNYGWGGSYDGFYKDGVCTIFNDNPSIITGIKPSNSVIKEMGDYRLELWPDGTASILAYLGSSGGTLEIPSTVEDDGITYKVKAIRERAFFSKGSFSKVIVGDNLEEVEPYSFFYTHIDTLVLGDGMKEVPDDAFGYTYIRHLTIGKNVRRIGKRAFSLCYLNQGIDCKSDGFELDDEAFSNTVPLNGEWVEKVTKLGKKALMGARFNRNNSWVQFPNLEAIGDSAFCGCSLGQTMPSFRIFSKVREIAPTAFDGWGSTAIISVEEDSPYFWADDNSNVYDKNKTTLILSVRDYSYLEDVSEAYPSTLVKLNPRSMRPGRAWKAIPGTVVEMDGAYTDCTASDFRDGMKCYAVVPPEIADSTFAGKLTEGEPYLFVPMGSETLYRKALGWRHFQDNVIDERCYEVLGDLEYDPENVPVRDYTMVLTTTDGNGVKRVSIPVSEIASMAIADDGRHVVVKRKGKDDLTTTVAAIDSISWLPGFVFENAEVYELSDSVLTAKAQKCTVRFDATCFDDDVQLMVRNSVLKPDAMEGVTRGFAVDLTLSNGQHELDGTAEITFPVSIRAGEKVHAAYYNTATGQWEPVFFTHDEQNHTITISTNHLTLYSVFFTIYDENMETELCMYDLSPHLNTLNTAMQKLLEVVSSDDPDDKMVQQVKSDMQLWQSFGLDGLWNVVRGLGEALVDFRPEAIDNAVTAMGYLGTALNILDVAAADIKGDDIGVAAGTMSTILNYAVGQMASAIGTPIMTVSMAGVAFIGIALNKFGTTVAERKYDLFNEAYRYFYSKKYGSSCYRSAKDWYKYFYPAFSEGKMTESKLNAYIEQSVRMYCEHFWESEYKSDYDFCCGEKDVKAAGGTYLYPEMAIRERISKEYFSELMNGTLVSVFTAIRHNIKNEANNRYRKAVNDMADMMNAKLCLRFSDSSRKKDEKSRFAGWKVKFTDLPSSLEDKDKWTMTIGDDGKLDYGFFTTYALMSHKMRSQVTLYNINDVEDKTFTFQVPEGTGKVFINIDLATGGTATEVPALKDLTLAYDPASVDFPAICTGTITNLIGERIYEEGGVEQGRFFMDDSFHKKCRFRSEIERFFRRHDFITVDKFGNIKIGDDVVGTMNGDTGTGKCTISNTYQFTENTLEEFRDAFNKNEAISLFAFDDLISGTVKHRIDCDFTVTATDEPGTYLVSYTGTGTYDVTAIVVDRIENIDWDKWMILNGVPIFDQHITTDDIRTTQVNQQGNVTLQYTLKLQDVNRQ